MIIQNSPYLRVQRSFPNDSLKTLSVENDRAYIDIATKVNDRIIGIFPTNIPAITGEQWFLQGSSQNQQTLRQVYSFSSYASPLSIPHGITTSGIYSFSKIYGVVYDGTNWYPLPYVDETAANNQISLKVTPTNIVITSGAGAPPAITSGIVVLEWLAVF